jgi:arylsulfatase A-like enzyme
MVCQLDLVSSLAALVGSDVRVPDSEEVASAFLGKSNKGRETLVLEATTRTALRSGDWAMIPPYDGPAIMIDVNIEPGNSDEYQLYNLKDDVGQKNNLAQSHPEKLQEMIEIFEGIRGNGYRDTENIELK